jgi:ABC-type glycerol-3-phosphate transport system substrate-binding protein
MKKYAYILVVASIVAAILLAACQPKETPTEVPPTAVPTVAATATPEPSPTPAKPEGNIVLWGEALFLVDTFEPAGIISGFESEYPDVTLEAVVYSNAEIQTNLPLALRSGEGAPDVGLVENLAVARYVAMGGLLDLTDRLQPYMDDFVSYKMADCTKDGRVYCVPVNPAPVVMYYRRDVFEAAGLSSDPTDVSNMTATWADYLDVCATITEQTGSYCYALLKDDLYDPISAYEDILWQQGWGYTDPATGELVVDSAENVAALELLRQLWESDAAMQDYSWSEAWLAAMNSRDQPLATALLPIAADSGLKTYISPDMSGKWGVALQPAVSAGQARASNWGGAVMVIPDQTQNPEAAWAFIEYTLLRQENVLKMLASTNTLPSLRSAYESPFFLETDPYFGGQNVRQFYADIVANMPDATVYGPNYVIIHDAVNAAIIKYATGEVDTAQEALTIAQEAILANPEYMQ